MNDMIFPNKFVEIVFKLNRSLGKIEAVLSMVILWALIAVVCVFISCRFIFHISTPWADESARYFLIAMGWMGASYAASVGDHLEIDLLGSIVNKRCRNPEKILAVVDRIAQILVMLFMCFFTYNYVQYVAKIQQMGTPSATLPVPLYVPMSLVTVGCLLIMLHTICKVLLPYRFWDVHIADPKKPDVEEERE